MAKGKQHYIGATHGEAFKKLYKDDPNARFITEGFVTNKGRFLTRKEATEFTKLRGKTQYEDHVTMEELKTFGLLDRPAVPEGPAVPDLDLNTAEDFLRQDYEATRKVTQAVPLSKTRGEHLGTTLIKQEAAKAGIQTPKLPASLPGAPFDFEAGMNPVFAMAMARTMGKAPPQHTLIQRAGRATKEWAKSLFVPEYRLTGREAIGPEGQKTTAFYNELRNAARLTKSSRIDAANKADPVLRSIVGPEGSLSPQDFYLAQLKLELDSGVEALARGKVPPLPGVTPEEALAIYTGEQQRLQPYWDRSPGAQAFYARHLTWTRAMGKELRAAGIIEQDADWRFYFHHKVMDYIRGVDELSGLGPRIPSLKDATGPASLPPGIRERNPSFAKTRSGKSAKDISRDYVGVMYEYMTEAYDALQIKHFMNEVERLSDVRNRPLNFVTPEELAAIRGAEAHNAKVMQEGKGQLVETPLPRGYVSYDVDRGFTGMRGENAAERLFNTALDKQNIPQLAKIFGVPDENMVKFVNQLQLQGMKPSSKKIIIPQNVAQTLLQMVADRAAPKAAIRVTEAVNKAFKWAALRAFPVRYGAKNLVGDSQKVFVQFGDEAFDKQLHKDVLSMLTDWHYRRIMTPTARKAIEQNVISSGHATVEANAIHAMPEFERFLQLEGSPMQYPKLTARQLKKWLVDMPYKANQFREDYWRLYVFRMNELRAAKGLPLLKGIVNIEGWDMTRPESVDAAIGKIARESLGDYGNFTSFENRLRNTAVPFYSWAAINLPFWPKAVGQAIQGGMQSGNVSAGAVMSGFAAVTAFHIGVRLYNNMVHGDLESKLSEYQQSTNHLILGSYKDKDGRERVLSIAVQDAWDDFLQAVGLQGVAPDIAKLASGNITRDEYLTRRREDAIFKDGYPAPALGSYLAKLIGPPYSTAYVGLSGRELFPNPLAKREVPEGERVASMMRTLAIPGEVAIGIHAPPTTGLLDIPTQLGLRRDVLRTDDPATQRVRMELFQVKNRIEDANKELRSLMSKRSKPNLTDSERAALVEQKKRYIGSLTNELQRAGRRYNDVVKSIGRQ